MWLRLLAYLFYGCGRWAVISDLRPVGDQVVDDEMAYAIGRVERGEIGAVLEDLGLGEAFCCGDTGALLVVVGRGAEDEDTVDVDFFCFG